MRKNLHFGYILKYGLIIALIIYVLWGIQFIPFHPDEVSLLYESRDFELLFTNPLAMAWQPGLPPDEYRLMNPPLPKYVIGLGRVLAGYSSQAVSVDWNWSLSMIENKARGALPPDGLLWAARLAVTLFIVFSLIIIFLCGRMIESDLTGILAMLFLGTNALVLLHGRRAMSEGVLLFGMTLSMLGILHGARFPWLAGLGVALAITSKHTAIALVPVGLIAVIWIPKFIRRDFLSTKKPETRQHSTVRIRNVFQYLGTVGIVFFLLNPILWKHPVGALQAMWQTRQEWATSHINTLETFGRLDQTLQGPKQRFAGYLFNLFVNPPMFYEVANYAMDTAESEGLYLSIPGHDVLRGFIGGGLMLILTIMGMVMYGIRTWRSKTTRYPIFRLYILMIIATLIQGIFLIMIVFLPAQRYVIPMVPFVCLWAAVGLSQPIGILTRFIRLKAAKARI